MSIGTKNPFGQWTVYRRKEDVGLWREFGDLSARLKLPASKAIAAAVRAWVEENRTNPDLAPERQDPFF